MNQKKGIKVGFIAAAIALLVVAVAVPAGAGDLYKKHDLNRLLQGDYEANSSFVCAIARSGFNEETLVRADGQPTYSGSTQGVFHYDGHGNYSFQGKALTVTHDIGTHDSMGKATPNLSPVSQLDMNCSGFYNVNADLSVEGEGECTIVPLKGPYLYSPYPPGFYSVIKGIQMKGQLLGTIGHILSLRADTEPNVEKGQFYYSTPSGPAPASTFERICTGSGMGMKLVGPAR
jgi:hypothetical protein